MPLTQTNIDNLEICIRLGERNLWIIYSNGKPQEVIAKAKIINALAWAMAVSARLAVVHDPNISECPETSYLPDEIAIVSVPGASDLQDQEIMDTVVFESLRKLGYLGVSEVLGMVQKLQNVARKAALDWLSSEQRAAVKTEYAEATKRHQVRLATALLALEEDKAFRDDPVVTKEVDWIKHCIERHRGPTWLNEDDPLVSYFGGFLRFWN